MVSENLDLIVLSVKPRYHEVSLSFQSECSSDPLQKLKHFNRKTNVIDVFALSKDS